jgi:hypothetical protein
MSERTKAEFILTALAAFLLLLFLVIIPIDVIDFYSGKETYAKVYNLDTSQENWEWQYLDRWIYLGLLIIVGLTVTALRLIRRDSEIIRRVNWAFLLLFFGSMIVGLFNWMKAGPEY